MNPKRKLESEKSTQKVNIKCTVVGEPAEIFLELKRRGIVRSARDAFVQGIICLNDKIVQRDLKIAQLKASKQLEEEF
ncbi:hypothetical protein KEJ15_09125 [Candidatus Bathyarchaeota archaeon]|nr:hypothetical protein [Candidatus Bathyarchaeota archaeon]